MHDGGFHIWMIGFLLIAVALLYYSVRRYIKLFWYQFDKKAKWISLVILLLLLIAFFISNNSESIFAEYIGTISMWIICGFLFSSPILIIQHLISIKRKSSKRIRIIILLGIGGYGYFNSYVTKITNVEIKSQKLEKNSKILLVSDIHVDSINYQNRLKKLIKIIEKEQPDIVLIAGDLLNSVKQRYIDAFRILNEVEIPIYAVLGNHDTMGDIQTTLQIEKISPLQFLRNEKLIIENWIQLIWIDDKRFWRNKEPEEILEEIQIVDEGFSILLTHQPIHFSKLKNTPIDLQVAGHTHWGQIRPLHYIAEKVNAYFYGLYQEGKKMTFITQGIGTRGLPFRLGTQSEIAIIHLLAK